MIHSSCGMYEPHELLLVDRYCDAVDISPEMHTIIKDTSGTRALHSLRINHMNKKIKLNKQEISLEIKPISRA